MKTIIFSDTHLTDKFDEKFYNFLTSRIEPVDQVIINGDFWDGMSISFEDFIQSKWKQLFPLLKSKKTIYLYGNHDRKGYSDERVNLFSRIQNYFYNLPAGRYNLHIEHGNEIVPFGDAEVADPVKMHRRGNEKYRKFEYMVSHITNGLYFLIYRLLFSKKMKRYVADNLKKNEILVTGHIHAPEFDLKNRYINTFVQHNIACYVLVDDNEIKFMREKI